MQKREDLGKLAETLEGVPVWGCLPGSVAQMAGIQYGDVVMAVNGQRTRDIDEYLAARELRDDGCEIVVFRNGEEKTVSLVFRRPTEAPDRLVEGVVKQIVDGRIMPTDDVASESDRPLN